MTQKWVQTKLNFKVKSKTTQIKVSNEEIKEKEKMDDGCLNFWNLEQNAPDSTISFSLEKQLKLAHQFPDTWKQYQRKLIFLSTATEPMQILTSGFEISLGLGSNLEKYIKEKSNAISILQKMAKLALRMPELLPNGLCLLNQNQDMAITLSQLQIATIMANAFFNTLTAQKLNRETFNSFSFDLIIRDTDNRIMYQKLLFLFSYFHSIVEKIDSNEPFSLVTIHRQSLLAFPDWQTEQQCFEQKGLLTVLDKGSIEDAHGWLQVDFANAFIGGGVLSFGAVQEEIMFLIRPECLITLLICEKMQKKEAILIKGAQQYSTYSGYAQSLLFKEPFTDQQPLDEKGRKMIEICAIDAFPFYRNPDKKLQFLKKKLERELNKAFAGFQESQYTGPSVGISTGNWGTGAFAGDLRLKAILQLMVGCLLQRSFRFYTFGHTGYYQNEVTSEEHPLKSFYDWLCDHRVSIGSLFYCLLEFSNEFEQNDNLFSKIREKLIN